MNYTLVENILQATQGTFYTKVLHWKNLHTYIYLSSVRRIMIYFPGNLWETSFKNEITLITYLEIQI